MKPYLGLISRLLNIKPNKKELTDTGSLTCDQILITSGASHYMMLGYFVVGIGLLEG